MSKKTLLLFLVLTCLAGGGWWLVSGRRGEARNVLPTTARVVRRDFASTVLATGAVRPQVGAEVRVGARISGKVERLHANIGDDVKKGQLIAELEKADLDAKVAQREAELRTAEARLSAVETLGPKQIDKAEAELREIQATHDLAEKELVRQKALLKGHAASRQDLDTVHERLSVTQAKQVAARKSLDLTQAQYGEDLKQARVEVEREKAALAEAKAHRSYATITAPIKGVIASVSTQQGETVAAGLNAPTFVTIIDLNRLQVDAFVDEVDIGKVRVGQKAVFTVDAFPAREFEGKVDAIYPDAVIQDNVVYYDTVVDIVSPYDGLLRPQMTTNVTIFLEARKGALAVPSKAVKRDRGKNVVYVLTEGEPATREVKVGWRDGQWIEILAGLSEGETVLWGPSNQEVQTREVGL